MSKTDSQHLYEKQSPRNSADTSRHNYKPQMPREAIAPKPAANPQDANLHGGSGQYGVPSDDGKRATSKGAVYGHDDYGTEDLTVGQLHDRVAASQLPPQPSTAGLPARKDTK